MRTTYRFGFKSRKEPWPAFDSIRRAGERSRVPVLLGSVCILFAGCASVSVQPHGSAFSAGVKPEHLIVGDFTYESRPSAGRSGKRLEQFEVNLVSLMKESLAKDLRHFGIPVEEAPSNQGAVLSVPQPAWLITGQFIRVNQGSRGLRVLIGLGAGRTKLQMEMQVYDLSLNANVPLFSFHTTGGSGAEPGLISDAGPGPVNAELIGEIAFDTVSGAQPGLKEDVKRTSKMIAAYISGQLAANGFISSKKARHPKLAGHIFHP